MPFAHTFCRRQAIGRGMYSLFSCHCRPAQEPYDEPNPWQERGTPDGLEAPAYTTQYIHIVSARAKTRQDPDLPKPRLGRTLMHTSLMPVPLCRAWNLSPIRLHPRLPSSQKTALIQPRTRRPPSACQHPPPSIIVFTHIRPDSILRQRRPE